MHTSYHCDTSSFTAWSDGVFLRQAVESTGLLSLSGGFPGEGGLHGMVDALVSNEQGIDSRCDAAMATLAGETDESASEVGVYGTVR